MLCVGLKFLSVAEFFIHTRAKAIVQPCNERSMAAPHFYGLLTSSRHLINHIDTHIYHDIA